jgi:phosphoglycolate phosphatase
LAESDRPNVAVESVAIGFAGKVMNRFTSVLFDLDGTLIDPGEGIARTIQFVLDRLAPTSPFDRSLAWYVGPPLTEIFRRLLLPDSRSELIEHAVSLYLERFATHGAQASAVYHGIADMLAELRINRRLFVVTSKNTSIAEQILTTHSLRSHFEGVIGTERDGRFANKADAVRFIAEGAKLDLNATAIVGDREHDVIAGKRNGIFTVGVTYGYGTRNELLSAGADRLCDDRRELLELLGERRDSEFR